MTSNNNSLPYSAATISHDDLNQLVYTNTLYHLSDQPHILSERFLIANKSILHNLNAAVSFNHVEKRYKSCQCGGILSKDTNM